MRYTGNRIVGSNPTLSATYPEHRSKATGLLRKAAEQADLFAPSRDRALSEQMHLIDG